MQHASLTLYQFPALWDVFSASPFCAKLEAFLRWQNVPHRVVTVKRLRGAPKGKVPYIQDGELCMGDSGLIIEHICKTRNLAPDAWLTAEQRAFARSITYLCEESLYRVMAYMRFVDAAGWACMQQVIFGKSRVLRWLAAPRIHAYVKKQLTQQGIARHTREEIIAIACADLDALNAMIGDKPFVFGQQPSTADLVILSVVGNLLTMPFDHEVATHARSLALLVAHSERVKQLCFGAAG